MQSIGRHEIDLMEIEFDIDRCQSYLPRFIDLVEGNPDALESVFDYALQEAEVRSTRDPRGNLLETWRSVVLAMQASSAMFAVAAQTEGEVEVRLLERVLSVPATGLRPHIEPGRWLCALWLAIVCRDRDRMDVLMRFPVEDLRAVDPAKDAVHDGFMYEWVHALQCFWKEDENLTQVLLKAMEISLPEYLGRQDEEITVLLLSPPIDVFWHLMNRDQDGFDKAFAHAVEGHKSYWARDEGRRRSPSGFIAWAPLALARLAKELGMSVKVESAYLPEALLSGDWIGEFPT